ncbi:(6-4)DNA photolyase isoform X1 [Aristolochia californica]|uniref:(6-4)DNA photolyase isoform X1 n=1 Tax=Aristolochia californica TaxID=171875 RepID=UPI0035E00388
MPSLLFLRRPHLYLSPSRFSQLSTSTTAMGSNSLIWFRKGLRIHDNPALLYAAEHSAHLYPVFVIDPHFMAPDPAAFSPGSSKSGLNRIQFLLESLADLDSSLRNLGSRLLVFEGVPAEVIIRLLKEWNIKKLCFECDTEPYSQLRDNSVKEFASVSGIEVFSPVSHTLFDPVDVIQKNGGKPPLSYQQFMKLVGQPPMPLEQQLTSLPSIGTLGDCGVLSVPKIDELGYCGITQEEFSPFRGGETEALNRLKKSLDDTEWVSNFEKPKGDPSAFLKPATTVLSPYLKFGCLSSRHFYWCLQDVYRKVKKHTSPPVSLVGQLLWREFFYTVAFGTSNFDRMEGNRICKQVPWKDNEELLVAWREARTGFPWIDAIMVQLHSWGWMHHLARHSVACFLTRGDLFVHWEKGRDVFERLLIDSDWAINNGN